MLLFQILIIHQQRPCDKAAADGLSVSGKEAKDKYLTEAKNYSTSDIQYYMSDATVAKELEIQKARAKVLTDQAELSNTEVKKSSIEIEQEAVREYQKRFGTKWQKEHIRSWEEQNRRASEDAALVGSAQDTVWGNLLDRAIQLNATGQPLGSSFFEDYFKESQRIQGDAAGRRGTGSIRGKDVYPIKPYSEQTVKDLLDTETAIIRYSDDGTPKDIVIPGTGTIGDIVIRSAKDYKTPEEFIASPLLQGSGILLPGETGIPEGVRSYTPPIDDTTTASPSTTIIGNESVIPKESMSRRDLRREGQTREDVRTQRDLTDRARAAARPLHVGRTLPNEVSPISNYEPGKPGVTASADYIPTGPSPQEASTEPVFTSPETQRLKEDIKQMTSDTSIDWNRPPLAADESGGEVAADVQKGSISGTVKDLAADVQRYAGRKYSTLTPAEQSHLDSVANALVKLHSAAISQKPSAEVDRTLLDIGNSVEALKSMDDVNDYNAPHAIAASKKAAELATSKGHGRSSITIPAAPKVSDKPVAPKLKEVMLNVDSAVQGSNKATEIYDKSLASDKPLQIKDSSLSPQKLNAIKAIASSPVKLEGKELDSALEKIAGDSWSIPSERSKYRQWITTYTLLS